MITSTRLIAFTYLLIFNIGPLKTESHPFDTVKTNAGFISGTMNKDGDVYIFKGVPFAAPPVGQLRWRAPQPVISWEGVRKCDAFGASPFQDKPVPFSMWSKEFLIPDEPIGEDCLYLNVWTGAKSPSEKRPVIVWIYGGGFSSGGSGCPIYDGEAMAKKGIVFVSINYRVGIFGFFAHPELTIESGKNASGNYGLLDQIAALQWVQKNIAVFGGDKNNVTIAGQSAGSMSVNCLVASPLTKTLFQKAIAESGAAVVSRGFVSNTGLKQAEEDGVKTATALNASSLEALRNIPADRLLKAPQGLRGPVVDGYVLPDAVKNIFVAAKESKVALLTGWNENEGLFFNDLKNAEDFKNDATKNYGSSATTFLKYYPAANDSEATASQMNLSRDMIFGVQNYTWANMQSEHGAKVYVYRFSRKVPATGAYIKYGAFHTGEVPYAFNNLSFVNRPWQPVDKELANTMSSYWANFAATGDPNGKDLPVWPKYDSKNKMIMVLDQKPAAKKLPDASALDFLFMKMSGN